MRNYTIANRNVEMNNHWTYALSVEGRNAFDKGNEEVKIGILMQLVNNGNITMPHLMVIMRYQSLCIKKGLECKIG